MKQFDHFKPPEMYEQEREHTHRMRLVEDGTYIGFADFEYRNDPFPFYYISMIFVKQIQRGKGFGREIIQQMNAFLDSKKIPGLLRNRIAAEHPAHDMYEHAGWTTIAGNPEWLGYHLPAHLRQGRLEKALHEILEGGMRAQTKAEKAA